MKKYLFILFIFFFYSCRSPLDIAVKKAMSNAKETNGYYRVYPNPNPTRERIGNYCNKHDLVYTNIQNGKRKYIPPGDANSNDWRVCDCAISFDVRLNSEPTIDPCAEMAKNLTNSARNSELQTEINCTDFDCIKRGLLNNGCELVPLMSMTGGDYYSARLAVCGQNYKEKMQIKFKGPELVKAEREAKRLEEEKKREEARKKEERLAKLRKDPNYNPQKVISKSCEDKRGVLWGEYKQCNLIFADETDAKMYFDDGYYCLATGVYNGDIKNYYLSEEYAIKAAYIQANGGGLSSEGRYYP